MENLIYQTVPQVTLATNLFVNVPIILQYDDIPLISLVKVESLGFTTELPIYHSDGTQLAKINGTRIFLTQAGKQANIEMSYPKGMTVCKLDGKVLFEIQHSAGDSFRMQAELYTPNGYFVKSTDSPMPEVINSSNQALNIGGMVMSGNIFSGCRIGVWIKSDGSIALGSS